MNKIVIAILFIWLSCTASAQSLPVGQTTVTYIDSSRGNRAVLTKVYYPATVAGINQPIDASSDKFPVIVFGHGYELSVSNYDWIARKLVPYGFIVAFPQTEGTSAANPSAFEIDLSFILKKLIQSGSDVGSLFNNKIYPKGAIGGHSMGGACSMLAAAHDTVVDCVFNFAAAIITPSPVAAATHVTIPLLMFGGKKDCVCAPSTSQTPIYNAAASECKALVLLDDADHCQFAAANASCQSYEIACGVTASIFDTIQQGRTATFLLQFLLWKLRDNINAGQQYGTLLAQSFNATSTWVCNALSVPAQNRKELSLYPNPTKSGFSLEIPCGYNTASLEMSIFDHMGRKFETKSIKGSQWYVSTLNWPEGIYFIDITGENVEWKKKIIITR